MHTDTQSVNNYLVKKDECKTIPYVVKQKKFRNTAISNRIGQFVTTCCLFNQEIVPSLNVACTLHYNQTTHSPVTKKLLSQTFASHISVPYSWLSFPAQHPHFLWDLRSSQQCCWTFQSSQMWHCLIGRVVPVLQRRKCLTLTTEGLLSFKTLVTCLMTPSYPRRLEYSMKTFIGCSP